MRIGFRLADKPADEDHPFGHARAEYLSGLAVAGLILIIGAELVKSSVGKILHPAEVEFSAAVVLVLLTGVMTGVLCAAYQGMLAVYRAYPPLPPFRYRAPILLGVGLVQNLPPSEPPESL